MIPWGCNQQNPAVENFYSKFCCLVSLINRLQVIKQENQVGTYSGIFNRGTTDILEWIILCYRVAICALKDRVIPEFYPLDSSSIHPSSHENKCPRLAICPLRDKITPKLRTTID